VFFFDAGADLRKDSILHDCSNQPDGPLNGLSIRFS
jgi:hypothetical protein